MVARPATRPSAGVLAIRSSSERRLRCAAMASAPYSTKLPASTRSAMFSRAVRRPCLCRLATAAWRPSSRVSRWRCADLVEVGPRPVEIDCSRRRFAVGPGAGAGEDQQRVSGSDDLAGRHQTPDRPQRVRRDEHVLHLHRLEDDQLAAGAELGAFGRHLDHGAGQLRAQHFLARVELDRRRHGRRAGDDSAAAANSGSFPSRKPVVTAARLNLIVASAALAEIRCWCECPRC